MIHGRKIPPSDLWPLVATCLVCSVFFFELALVTTNDSKLSEAVAFVWGGAPTFCVGASTVQPVINILVNTRHGILGCETRKMWQQNQHGILSCARYFFSLVYVLFILLKSKTCATLFVDAFQSKACARLPSCVLRIRNNSNLFNVLLKGSVCRSLHSRQVCHVT